MEFIKNHQAHSGEFRIVEQHAGQHAFGHHFQARPGTHPGIGTGAVAYRLPHGFSPLRGHKRGHRPGRHTAWLQHQNFPALAPLTVQQRQGYTGGLPRPRRRLKNGTPVRL